MLQQVALDRGEGVLQVGPDGMGGQQVRGALAQQLQEGLQGLQQVHLAGEGEQVSAHVHPLGLKALHIVDILEVQGCSVAIFLQDLDIQQLFLDIVWYEACQRTHPSVPSPLHNLRDNSLEPSAIAFDEL